MNLFPHLRPGTPDYTPPLLNPSDAATVNALSQAAHHGRVSTKITEAVAYTVAYAGAYADYHAPCASPVDADGRYDLNAFMTDAYALARRLASRALGPAAQVRLVVPMWVHTVQQAITEDVITVPNYDEPGGDVWRAIAIAAADRPPSLLLASWDWCATFPCTTPDAGTQTQHDESRACSGTCDDSEAAA